MNKKEESRKKKTHEGVRRFAGSQAARGGCNTETNKHKKKGAMRDVGTGVYRRARVHGGHYASYVGLNAGDAS